MDNFYMNHRDFVTSRSFEQLRAETRDPGSHCDGAEYIEEIFDFNETLYKSYGGVPLDGKSIARPCGLHAKSFLNDTISFWKDDYEYNINTTHISNDADRDYVFKKYDNSSLTDWLDTTDGKLFIN